MAYEFVAPSNPRPPYLLQLLSLLLIVVVSIALVWLSSDLERLRMAEQRLREQQDKQQEATMLRLQAHERQLEEQQQIVFLENLWLKRKRISVMWDRLLLQLPDNIVLHSARGTVTTVELSGNARSLRGFSRFLEVMYRDAEYYPTSFAPLVHQSGEESSYTFSVTLTRRMTMEGAGIHEIASTP